MSFTESAERQALRESVRQVAKKFGIDYVTEHARRGVPLTELWQEMGAAGFLGVNLPEEYGGGGAGIYELALVLEEASAEGAPLIMMVVSPAIVGTVLARYGTLEQRRDWLPGIASGDTVVAFGITEPDAGSNSHRLSTVARRDGSDWILSGQKTFVTGVTNADAVLVVGRIAVGQQRLRPAMFLLPRETAGFTYQPIEMDIVESERQCQLFFDDVRLPAGALVGGDDAPLEALFAGLNPERIMGAALAAGTGRFAIGKARRYLLEREVWGVPIGAHQGLAHPLAQCHIEVELSRLMLAKAATLYDEGSDKAAGEAANMAKYAAAEASIRALDQAIQCHGGNGLAAGYGLAMLLGAARVARVAPVSREMILNFVAQHSLGLPKSY
ncbi:MAG TPA: acyl-CoA dehydrogenase family protein [Streptosporangiaceae bacterium]|nr:acyl-CoA dehydrogenase family protein [Streptosporangiaceae bacterium]